MSGPRQYPTGPPAQGVPQYSPRPSPTPAPSAQPPENPSGQRKKAKHELQTVRRRDVRRLRDFGPPPGVWIPNKHGDSKDPRYPSGKSFRIVFGFIIDLALHVGGAVGVVVASTKVPALSNYALVYGIVAFFVLSIVHRIFVQRMVYTTLGKALFALRVIRDDNGGPPTIGALVKQWFLGVLGIVLTVLDGGW